MRSRDAAATCSATVPPALMSLMGAGDRPVRLSSRIHTAAYAGIAVLILALSAAPTHASEPSTACGPATLWTRMCSPMTVGTAPIEGTVVAGPGMAAANVSVMFRTVEGSLGPASRLDGIRRLADRLDRFDGGVSAGASCLCR